MLESTIIALKFPEDKLPPLPGSEYTDQEVRAVLALHLEKTQFADSEEIYEKNVSISLEEMGIADEAKEKIIAARETLEVFLSILIEKLQEQQLAKVKNEGIHKYYPFIQYVYYDEEEQEWRLDLEKFQENEAKFDNLLLYDGQFIVKFNPVQTNNKPMTLIVGEQYKIRDYSVDGMKQIQQQLQQQMLSVSGQCSCGNTPCSCGAVASQLQQVVPQSQPQPPNTDDEEEEKSDEEFQVWDELLQEAEDRDVILVYNSGEEIARF